MSISSAPLATASDVSAIFTSSNDCDDGKAPDTQATFTDDTSSTARTTPAKLGYTHMAATLGREGKRSSKSLTLCVKRATDDGESVDLSVVRSMVLNRKVCTSLVLFSAKCSSRIFCTAAATASSEVVTALASMTCVYLSVFCSLIVVCVNYVISGYLCVCLYP